MKMNIIYKIKMNSVLNLLLIMSMFIVILSCDMGSDPDEDKPDELYIKFINNEASEYTITSIELMAMGKADEASSSPSGVWSDNILSEGQTIAPGSHRFFTLEIPNLHYCQYRLGVDNGQGFQIMLHLQDGYSSESISPPTITHWGSDERTVGVTVVNSSYSDLIVISGWSDWAGID